MIYKKFKITNESGVNARPATALVNLCMRFDSNIVLEALKKEVDC
ncbi:MAG: HPr family phosphocarrier protein, partial [Anaeroplasmataceae bacterium]|nr:HPr family phosphocarrier protein [Anaeroplasmataceae bacterium]